MISSLCN